MNTHMMTPNEIRRAGFTGFEPKFRCCRYGSFLQQNELGWEITLKSVGNGWVKKPE